MVGFPVRNPQHSGGVGCFVSSLNPRCAWMHLEVEAGAAPTLQSRYIFIKCAKYRIASLNYCDGSCRLSQIILRPKTPAFIIVATRNDFIVPSWCERREGSCLRSPRVTIALWCEYASILTETVYRDARIMRRYLQQSGGDPGPWSECSRR